MDTFPKFIFYILGLATWHTPTGGMFLWMEFIGLENSFQLVMDHLLKRKVLLVAGGAFNLSENKPTPYVRVSYSRASLEDMEKVSTCLDKQKISAKIVNISLPIILSICFGCSKESPH